jgi:hypothetical protein
MHVRPRAHLRVLGCTPCVVLQVGIIGADQKFRVLTESEVADYLQEVE